MTLVVTAPLIARIAPGARPEWAEALARNWPRIAALAGLTTPARAAHFLAQVLHESAGLTAFEENLSYSAERICAVWPSRFRTLAEAAACARNPRALANRVYGGRMGNSHPDDGWRFRGKGPIQLTGRGYYRTIGRLIGVDLEADPRLVLRPDIGWLAAAAVWADKRCNGPADLDDLEGVTRRINGGLNGLADRRRRLAAVRRALGAAASAEPGAGASPGSAAAAGGAVILGGGVLAALQTDPLAMAAVAAAAAVAALAVALALRHRRRITDLLTRKERS